MQAIRSRGSDSNELRDAAHEAAHAIQAGLRPPWTRDRVHDAVSAFGHGNVAEMLASEVLARAVERIVVVRVLGADQYDAEKWAAIALMEAMKTMHVSIPISMSPQRLAKSIEERAEGKDARRIAEKIMNLKPLRKP